MTTLDPATTWALVTSSWGATTKAVPSWLTGQPPEASTFSTEAGDATGDRRGPRWIGPDGTVGATTVAKTFGRLALRRIAWTRPSIAGTGGSTAFSPRSIAESWMPAATEPHATLATIPAMSQQIATAPAAPATAPAARSAAPRCRARADPWASPPSHEPTDEPTAAPTSTIASASNGRQLPRLRPEAQAGATAVAARNPPTSPTTVPTWRSNPVAKPRAAASTVSPTITTSTHDTWPG